MSRRHQTSGKGRGWRLGLATVCIAGLIVALCWLRAGSTPEAQAQQAPAASAPGPAPSAPQNSAADALSGVVYAYIYHNVPITREQLADYLITRYGAAKLPLLVNHRIIEEACKASHIHVDTAEVEAAANDYLITVNMDRHRFAQEVLKAHKLNEVEWKEDLVRPKLLLTKLCQSRVTWTEEDIRRAYEARWGEKIDCRMIVWPLSKDPNKAQEEEAVAMREWASLRDNEEAFAQKAKNQANASLASRGGYILPITWGGTGFPEAEKIAFRLQPGEVSTLMKTTEGLVVLKCDKRIPPDNTVSLETQRPKLIKDAIEAKTQEMIKTVFEELKEAAKPKILLHDSNAPDTQPAGSQEMSGPVVAYINNNVPITREQLGDWLIARYGPEKLKLLVHRRIIDEACNASHVTVSDAEVEAAASEYITSIKSDRAHFVKEVLKPNKVSFYEWKEDVLRPKLLLTRLCRSRVTWNEEDIRQAYAAHWGEKVDCRMIMWPRNEEQVAMREWTGLRDSEDTFAQKARLQASSELAAKGGHIPPIARGATGSPEVEKVAFSLQPGDVSHVIGTPEGWVVLKCDKRLPADKTVSLDSQRPQLIKDVIEAKIQAMIPIVFAELKVKASPKIMLKDTEAPEDLAASIHEELPGFRLSGHEGTHR